MKSQIRLTCAINKVHLADPAGCLKEVLRLLDETQDADITVFPKLSLCGAGCGSLFKNPFLTEACEKALEVLREYTRGRGGYVIVGYVTEHRGGVVSAAAVMRDGEFVAIIPSPSRSIAEFSSSQADTSYCMSDVFTCGSLRFCVLDCELSDLAARSVDVPECDLIIVPSYTPMWAGKLEEITDNVRALSASIGCAVAVVNGGVGDTSSPWLYEGFIAVYERGKHVLSRDAGFAGIAESIALDSDNSAVQKIYAKREATAQEVKPREAAIISQKPFLPENNPEEYLAELFRLQARSLAVRMDNTGIRKLVIGISGGIDSASALLAAVKAVDSIGIPRENIIAISMPGPGTSGRTHANAERLMNALGVSKREIPIGEAVKLHLSDIGHDGRHDAAYENAQARERTQILMNIANMEGGLVVGTGDLSEAALGFCTFGGDHIANYNVNICITKTVLRELLKYQRNLFKGEAGDAIEDILATPVSPELLPPDEHGDPAQKTEEILGPYGLHDFFLYHFVKLNQRPSQICKNAVMAFSGVYDPLFIREKLALFLGRFCAAQFKRSCSPDAASITEVNLLGVNYYIPSDLNFAALLRESSEE